MLKYTLGFAAVLGTYAAPAQSIPDTTTSGTHSFIELGGLASSARQTPFWLRSRQYGIVPLTSPAGIVRAGTTFFRGDPTNPRRVHLKAGAEIASTVAQSTLAEPGPVRLLLPEAYVSARLGKFELYAGRRREVFGLVDTLMTSGSYAWSGNALPITKVQVGTQGFAPLGFTKGIVAINALFAHGWYSNTESVQGSFLHQKALFARLNLWRGQVRLLAGVTHHAQWGGRSSVIGNLAPNGRIPSSLRDYWDVVTAQQPPNDTINYSGFDRANRAGNHVGSIDAAVELAGSRSNWYLYVQHPYEDKSGVAFQNVPDGLYGIRWRNAIGMQQTFQLLQVTAEILSTTDQGGFNIKTGSRLYDGADDYFNNYQFVDGWTHQRRVIGTPFVTRTQDARPDLADLKGGFGPMAISNNRVNVVHLGVLGGWPSGAQVRMLLSQSNNLGRPITSDSRMPRAQFSGMVEGLIPVRWLGDSQVRITLAVDQGTWLPNSVGSWLSFRKLL